MFKDIFEKAQELVDDDSDVFVEYYEELYNDYKDLLSLIGKIILEDTKANKSDGYTLGFIHSLICRKLEDEFDKEKDA